MQNSNNQQVKIQPADLRLNSKSYRFYYQLTFKFKPLDVIIMQYLIAHFKLSVGFGKHGKNGKHFYRQDKKITGFYFATTLSKLVKDLPCKTSPASLNRSLIRLQKHGYIIKHHSINCLQIFMPIMDHSVQSYLNDNNYHTTINPKYFRFNQNDIIDNIKMTLSKLSKRYYRYYQNDKNNNNRINNNRINNNRINNVVVSSLNKKPNNKQQQTKAKAKTRLPKWINNNLNQSVGNLVLNHTKSISKTKDICTSIIDNIFSINKQYSNIRGSEYFRTSSNPYIQNGELTKDLKNTFKDKKDPKVSIKDDYQHYIMINTNLKPEHSTTKNDNGTRLQAKDRYEKNMNIAYQYILKYKNTNYTDKYKKYSKDFDNNIKEYSELSGQPLWTLSLWNNVHPQKLHPTSAKTQHKIQNQLKDLNKPLSQRSYKKKKPVKRENLGDYKPTKSNFKKMYNDPVIKVTKHGYQVFYDDTVTGQTVGVDTDKRAKAEIETKEKQEKLNNRVLSNLDTGKETKYKDLKNDPSIDPQVACSVNLIDHKQMNKLLKAKDKEPVING